MVQCPHGKTGRAREITDGQRLVLAGGRQLPPAGRWPLALVVR